MSRLTRSFGTIAIGIVVTFGTALFVVSSPASATGRQPLQPMLASHETPTQLLSAAEATTLAARSVTLTEHLLVGGALDSVTIKGRWPERLYVSVARKAFAEQIVITTAHVYVRLNTVAWEQAYKLGATPAAGLAGRWFVTTRSDPALGGSTKGFDPKRVEKSLFDQLNKATPRLVERTARVGGRPALALADAGGAIYLATTGRPYVLRITTKLPGDNGFLEFANFNHSTGFALPRTSTALDAALRNAEGG